MSKPNPPDPIFVSEYDDWVEDGEYELLYVGHDYPKIFKGRPKLFMRFRIVSLGKEYDKILRAFYNVKVTTKGYGAPPTGKLSREMATLFGRGALRNGTPFGLLKTAVVIGAARTVLKDSQNRSLHKENRYSVVDRLIKLA
jgi:hypothetical protein